MYCSHGNCISRPSSFKCLLIIYCKYPLPVINRVKAQYKYSSTLLNSFIFYSSFLLIASRIFFLSSISKLQNLIIFFSLPKGYGEYSGCSFSRSPAEVVYSWGSCSDFGEPYLWSSLSPFLCVFHLCLAQDSRSASSLTLLQLVSCPTAGSPATCPC